MASTDQAAQIAEQGLKVGLDGLKQLCNRGHVPLRRRDPEEAHGPPGPLASGGGCSTAPLVRRRAQRTCWLRVSAHQPGHGARRRRAASPLVRKRCCGWRGQVPQPARPRCVAAPRQVAAATAGAGSSAASPGPTKRRIASITKG
jgi:hypothetical protein